MTFGDIDKDFGGCVFDVEEAEDGGSVVGDGGISGGGDHFVHTSGSEGCFDNIDYCFNGVDVGNDLSDTFHGFGTISEKKNGGLLTYKKRVTSKWLMLILC